MESKMVALRVQKSSFAPLLALLRAAATSIGMYSVTSAPHRPAHHLYIVELGD